MHNIIATLILFNGIYDATCIKWLQRWMEALVLQTPFLRN